MPETDDLPQGAGNLQERRNIHMAIIVDEYGSTEGIITSADMLEAIVGILPSNYDDMEAYPIRERRRWNLAGRWRTPIHEIQLTFGIDKLIPTTVTRRSPASWSSSCARTRRRAT